MEDAKCQGQALRRLLFQEGAPAGTTEELVTSEEGLKNGGCVEIVGKPADGKGL